MAKKKDKKWPPTHPAGEGPEPVSEVKPEKAEDRALVESLLNIEGVNEEIAEHAAKYGVADDAYVVQTFYRVTDTTARAIIKAVKEAKRA